MHPISEAITLLLERSKLLVEGAGAVGGAALLGGYYLHTAQRRAQARSAGCYGMSSARSSDGNTCWKLIDKHTCMYIMLRD